MCFIHSLAPDRKSSNSSFVIFPYQNPTQSFPPSSLAHSLSVRIPVRRTTFFSNEIYFPLWKLIFINMPIKGFKKGKSETGMSDDSKQKHREAFEAIAGEADEDGTQRLSFEELKSIMPPEVAEDELERAFKRADENGSGRLCCEEWLDFCWCSYLEEADRILSHSDENHDGRLTRDEVEAAFCGGHPPASKDMIDMIMKQFDESGDGKITKEELLDFLSGANE